MQTSARPVFFHLQEFYLVDHTFQNLSLCSGGGGLEIGLALAIGDVRTLCYVEREAFAIDYLVAQMEAETLYPAPIWTDIRTFNAKPWSGGIDTLTAGYPCQPFSNAGKRRGASDPRHLWPYVAEIICDTEPGVVFLENVPGHLSLGYAEVEADLQRLGYTVTPGLFSAQEVGASQLRDRLFILAVADRCRQGLPKWEGQRRSVFPQRTPAERESVEVDERVPLFPPGPDDIYGWQNVHQHAPGCRPAVESGFCQLVDGMAPDRRNWLETLGNGVVPLQAAYAFISLWSVYENRGS
jgi:DNA (cytosine-5)-methyltransferase 1